MTSKIVFFVSLRDTQPDFRRQEAHSKARSPNTVPHNPPTMAVTSTSHQLPITMLIVAAIVQIIRYAIIPLYG